MKPIEKIRQENLQRLASELGGPAALARALGDKSASQISQWLNASRDSKTGKPRSIGNASAREIEAVLGKPYAWLDTPHDVALTAAMPLGRVPLISWVQAGKLTAVDDHFLNDEPIQWIETFLSKPGKNSFALRIEGDSMTSQLGGLSFPEGCIILVDPNRAPKPGDYVVAHNDITKEATFKRLMYDGGMWFLKPLNPAYPTIRIDDPNLCVIGVAIEWQLGGKL
jgi:SOS-response transcriptional repressor LexA